MTECEPGICYYGECTGYYSDYGPCGECCACLGECLRVEGRLLADCDEYSATMALDEDPWESDDPDLHAHLGTESP